MPTVASPADRSSTNPIADRWLAGDNEWSNDPGLNVIEYRLAID
jgi:hypothetical protein